MPRLRRRSDGCYYVVHYFDDYSTWQIDRDGIRFLEDASVRLDDLFSVDLFMEMWRRRLVYVGPDRNKYWKDLDQRDNRFRDLMNAKKLRRDTTYDQKL